MAIEGELKIFRKWTNPTDYKERCPFCGEEVQPHTVHQCELRLYIYSKGIGR